MIKSKQAKPPPLQRAVYGLVTTPFEPKDAKRIVDAIGKPAFRDTVWTAEALNDAASNFYVTVALSRAAPPSRQAEWANRLKVSADACIGMLAPDTRPTERPRFADDRAHSALLRWAGPPGDVDALAGALWDLRRMADYAEQEWRAEMRPHALRRTADQAVIGWISDLADIYERVFHLPAPAYPQKTSAFTIFAERARAIARKARAPEHGTDNEAREKLGKLTAARLCSSAREHVKELERRQRELRARDYVPSRIATGETIWNDRNREI